MEVLGVDDAPGGRLAVHIRTQGRPACGGCGGAVWSKGASAVGLVDLPAFGRPVCLMWHKWRWRCPAATCDVASFTEVNEQIAPARSALTARVGRWATVAVGRDARPVADVAAELGCDWHTANRAVLASGGALSGEISELDTEIARLCAQANPALLAARGVGPDVAATLLITAGDNPERLTSGRFAFLWGEV